MFDLLSFLRLPYTGLFIGALFCFIGSLVLFNKGKEKIAIAALFFCALLLRLFMAFQDHFLHMWDEQFHALVARNLMDNPLLPILKKYSIDGYDPFHWNNSHIWLHKQPLFMWQMALSLKIFGVSEVSIRIPSVLMGALTVPLLYGITKSLTGHKLTAYYAAIILCFCAYQLEMISGVKGMDHNDVAYYFYVLASIWAYTRYLQHKSRANIVLIGVFVGCAILNKWLLGILVYAGWAINILLNTDKTERKKEIGHVLLAGVVSAALALPWQLYIHHAFPLEASFESAFNARHLTEVIEGHDGSIFCYVDNFPNYFGEVGWFFVIVGFVVLLLKTYHRHIHNRQVATALLTMFSVVFIFFSYIAKTKLDSFFFVVAPIGIILMAVAFAEIKQRMIQAQKPVLARFLTTGLVVATVISIFNPDKIYATHNPNDKYRIAKSKNVLLYKQLRDNTPPNTRFVLNAAPGDDIEAMFYNNDCMVYPYLLGKFKMDSLKEANVHIVVIGNSLDSELREFVTAYPNITIVNGGQE